ncbi:MAG: hypothetical protein CSA18_00540 [Deltaproteobacteria bacterium]|nr:MAG: hypothetical protein CSA18_00540 [Deltaproteobacteria bacterium]
MINFKVISKNETPEAAEILEKMSGEGKLEVTFSKFEEIKVRSLDYEADSQSMAIVLFLELRKHGLSKYWNWVRGIHKKNSVFHSWLEFKGWVVDPLPAYRFSGENFKIGDILVVREDVFFEKTGFKIMSTKKEKHVLKWLEKINNKYM